MSIEEIPAMYLEISQVPRKVSLMFTDGMFLIGYLNLQQMYIQL